MKPDLLQASLARINFADSQFHDGNLDNGDNHAYEILRREVETAAPSMKVTALLKLAKVCTSLNRYVEAQWALQRLSRLLKSGEVVSTMSEYKLKLCLAQIRFDQGRFSEAQALLEKMETRHITDEIVLGECHSLLGQLAGEDIRSRCQPETDNGDIPAAAVLHDFLAIAVHHQGQALMMFTNANSYQLMQCACMHLGHHYLHAFLGHPDKLARGDLLELGIGWIVQSELICSKFGVGMNSNRRRIALIKLMLDGALQLSDLNKLTAGMFRHHNDVESMAQDTLAEVARVGNRLELAEMMIVMAELARGKNDESKTASYLQQAIEIYGELKRPDLIRQIKKDFPVKHELSDSQYGYFAGRAAITKSKSGTHSDESRNPVLTSARSRLPPG